MQTKSELTQNIELSVIVPVYNVEKYIGECLESIVSQKMENVEIILVNDGSTDKSKEICECFCHNTQKIYLHNQINQGVSVARNKGIELARGRYVIFLDSDDWLIKDIIPEFLKCLDNTDADLIVSRYDTYLERVQKYVKSTENNITVCQENNPIEVLGTLTYQNPYWLTVTSVCVKRQFILKNKLKFKEGIRHEDELWIHQLFLAAHSISMFEKSLFCYRFGREDSFNKTNDIKKVFDRMFVTDEFNKMETTIKNEKARMLLRERKAVLIWAIIRELDIYKNDINFQELLQNIQGRIKYLKYGRHFWKYLACKIFGIKGACGLANIKESLRAFTE